MKKHAAHHVDWEHISKMAWDARNRAVIFGRTKVGCALVTSVGYSFAGCNLEHPFHSNDIHAEISAINSMMTYQDSSPRDIQRIIIVAERDHLTPCGSCLDWITYRAHKDCEVGVQSSPTGEITVYTLEELMPFYPR